jgi:hypothetical protein
VNIKRDYIKRLHFEMQQSLTLSLTVSLILAPALLTTPVKNEPNDLAPAVILLVTKTRAIEKEMDQITNQQHTPASFIFTRLESFYSRREISYKMLAKHTIKRTRTKYKFISNLLPFPTIPAWSSVGEPFSETGRESAPPVALNGGKERMREEKKQKGYEKHARRKYFQQR